MKKIEYDLPVFKDEDVADLNEYSKQMANAIKVQIDKFGNPIIFKGTVETLDKLEELLEVKNGYVYGVISENKNYIYNGSEWVEYSDIYNISLLATKSELQEHGVVVSSTEPTTGEKVWLQKGDNLFDKNSITRTAYLDSTGTIQGSSANWAISEYMEVVPGKKYTYQGLTNVGETPCSVYYDKDKNFVSSFKQDLGMNIITIPEHIYYVRFSINVNTDYLDEETFIFMEGISKIYVKNDNGVYEEFINKENNIARTLYNSTSGTTGTVTLLESAINFKYLEIYFKLNGNSEKMVKVFSPNGKLVQLDGSWVADDTNGTVQTECKTYQISGKSVTAITNEWCVNLETSGVTLVGKQSQIKILKVVGYR